MGRELRAWEGNQEMGWDEEEGLGGENREQRLSCWHLVTFSAFP